MIMITVPMHNLKYKALFTFFGDFLYAHISHSLNFPLSVRLVALEEQKGTPQWKLGWITICLLIISYYNSSNVCVYVCVCVCSLSPPRSFDGSSPNLVSVCRWTSELPLRGSFSKRSTGRRVNGSLPLSLYYICARLTPHSCKRRLLRCCYCI